MVAAVGFYPSLCFWAALKWPLSHLLLISLVIALTVSLSWLISLSHCEGSVPAPALCHSSLEGMRASLRASFSPQLQCIARSSS